jgi:hypothetical protein
MSAYEYKDVVAAFEYGQKNPGSSIKNFLNDRRWIATKEELKYYKNISWDTFEMTLKGKSYTFYLFTVMQYYQPLENLVEKISGDGGYYKINPMPGEWNAMIHYIVGFDENKEFFTLNDWDDHEDFSGVKVLRNEDRGVTFMYGDFDTDDWDEQDFERWDNYRRRMEKEKLTLWNGGGLKVYLDTKEWQQGQTWSDYLNNNFEFKPVKELFNCNKDE